MCTCWQPNSTRRASQLAIASLGSAVLLKTQVRPSVSQFGLKLRLYNARLMPGGFAQGVRLGGRVPRLAGKPFGGAGLLVCDAHHVQHIAAGAGGTGGFPLLCALVSEGASPHVCVAWVWLSAGPKP